MNKNAFVISESNNALISHKCPFVPSRINKTGFINKLMTLGLNEYHEVGCVLPGAWRIVVCNYLPMLLTDCSQGNA